MDFAILTDVIARCSLGITNFFDRCPTDRNRQNVADRRELGETKWQRPWAVARDASAP